MKSEEQALAIYLANIEVDHRLYRNRMRSISVCVVCPRRVEHGVGIWGFTGKPLQLSSHIQPYV